MGSEMCIRDSYNSTYNVTLNDVLCMLEMMKYYNYIPLEVMYGDNVIANSYVNPACSVLENENSSYFNEITGTQYTNNVYNKLLVNSYEVGHDGNVDENWSTSNNSPPNQVIIIPGGIQLPNGIIIQYTYCLLYTSPSPRDS